MKNIVFLGSGGGGNLKFIHKYFGKELFNISGILTDRYCGLNAYADSENINHKILSFKRNEIENKVLIDAITLLSPDIIITNVHKILSLEVVNYFKGKLINLHYSYLPAFKSMIGMKPVDEAVKLNNLFIGTTVHIVSEQVDSGNTISQGIFCRKKFSNIHQKTFECGALTLLSAILFIDSKNNKIIDDFNGILISPSSDFIKSSKFLKIFKILH